MILSVRIAALLWLFRMVVCGYCNTSYDVEDAYSEAYKYHKGMMDAATEGFEK